MVVMLEAVQGTKGHAVLKMESVTKDKAYNTQKRILTLRTVQDISCLLLLCDISSRSLPYWDFCQQLQFDIKMDIMKWNQLKSGVKLISFYIREEKRPW